MNESLDFQENTYIYIQHINANVIILYTSGQIKFLFRFGKTVQEERWRNARDAL